MNRHVSLTLLTAALLSVARAPAADEHLAPADPHPQPYVCHLTPPSHPKVPITHEKHPPGQPHHRRHVTYFPSMRQMLFGGTNAEAVVRGRYYAVRPNGSLGPMLGTFWVRGDDFRMFPAGGDQIQVLLNDAPSGGVLKTDFAHYATPPIDPLVVDRTGPASYRIGPEHQNEPHAFLSRSSGSLNFFLGGPTLDAEMQQKYVTVSSHYWTGGTRTREDVLAPVRIRFIPD